MNGIYSAAFCESAALRLVSSSSPSQRNRTLCTSAGNCTAMPRALPLGELASRSDDGEGEPAKDISGICGDAKGTAAPNGMQQSLKKP